MTVALAGASDVDITPGGLWAEAMEGALAGLIGNGVAITQVQVTGVHVGPLPPPGDGGARRLQQGQVPRRRRLQSSSAAGQCELSAAALTSNTSQSVVSVTVTLPPGLRGDALTAAVAAVQALVADPALLQQAFFCRVAALWFNCASGGDTPYECTGQPALFPAADVGAGGGGVIVTVIVPSYATPSPTPGGGGGGTDNGVAIGVGVGVGVAVLVLGALAVLGYRRRKRANDAKVAAAAAAVNAAALGPGDDLMAWPAAPTAAEAAAATSGASGGNQKRRLSLTGGVAVV
jgi:hypothetical protein